jgi:hypothetical protein
VPDFLQRTGRSTFTVLLRVLTEPAEDGRVVGHAEVIDTGEVVTLHCIDDLVTLVQRLATRTSAP